MNKLLFTLIVAFVPILSALASPTPSEEVTSLIHDKALAGSHIQQFLDGVYKGGNTQLVDNSLFSPYSSGSHRYLIAKAYITFYNENSRQQVLGILLDTDTGWICSITSEQLDYFVRTGDRSYLPKTPNLDPNAGSQPPFTDPGLTVSSSPNNKWPDGRILTHPEHSVRTWVIKVKSGDTLILRSGPGTRFESIGAIPRDGTGLIAFDQDRVWDGDTWWYPIEWRGYRGYVGRSFLGATD